MYGIIQIIVLYIILIKKVFDFFLVLFNALFSNLKKDIIQELVNIMYRIMNISFKKLNFKNNAGTIIKGKNNTHTIHHIKNEL
ncbi:hypothetical protein bsdE14_21050 [Clostridium omnivorum]|uniref:Uncharacterized protein n=1 Tax=Clostridium omnivorum TaxID=1604902 RepID=A0ABQ5N6C4_9CLOT|nr:hypothetical protein bsdE14_21050 [Clostridium sp. E14]